MESTTFSDKIIPQINNVLKFVLENPYSDFYRNKYKGLGIKEIRSYEDFRKIPFLTKDEFRDLPLEKRTFVPEEQIAYYSFSGGTTNQGKPTIIPHIPFSFEDYAKRSFNEDEISSFGVTNIITLLVPVSMIMLKIFSLPKKRLVVIPGDINNLKLTARISREIKIQGIITLPTRLYFFIRCLKEIGFDLNEIKWVRLTGEYCSQQRLDYFRSELPNAFIDFKYGVSEIGGNKGNRCDHLSKTQIPSVFHPVTSELFEVIDEKNKSLPLGETGQLCYSETKIKAFPLLRYKVGDLASLVRRTCICGNEYDLVVHGRIGSDVIEFNGATISVQSVENALDPIRQFIEPVFRVDILEESNRNKTSPKLQLHLSLKKGLKDNKSNSSFVEILKEKVSDNLYLQPEVTLKKMVEQGVISPLEIIFVESWPEEKNKWKSIISHLSR